MVSEGLCTPNLQGTGVGREQFAVYIYIYIYIYGFSNWFLINISAFVSAHCFTQISFPPNPPISLQ